ncbi:hypothetical protein [Streptomyces coeruleorubidus]|uniref:Uncharacterized protein n=1 Tax=Streptomyces coeruleorubidus TaxID=116188 RepID=A0A5J6I5B0_STRC4|nr:hypothetical protein [Streptomyces coeruleorubidus]QEV24005.1 hypothetical protein CP976_07485 [Streptomyces coeruleorubidus]GGT85429.1 hypothetical protein GCM10010256_51910 [Streptomyces coeruleorubidus]
MNADEFNALYEVGTPVVAYPSIRPEHPVAVAYQQRVRDGRCFGTTDPCRRLVTRTRTPAWTLGHAAPVVSVDGYAGGIILEHVDVISEDEFAKARAEETAAAVAAQGALPVPVGDQPQPLDDQRLAEIAARVDAASQGPWKVCEDYSDVLDGDGHQIVSHFHDADGQFTAHARQDVPALLAEVQRLNAELAKYVGNEPTLAEEMEYLSRCLNAVRDLCDATEKQATKWENPLPVPEWVEQVRAATDGVRPDDPNDNRHRIFVDGKGNGWISVCSDEGTEWVVPIQPAAHVEQDVKDIADETGSLREIGRCW